MMEEEPVNDDVNIQKLFNKMLKQREDENRVKNLRESFAFSKKTAINKRIIEARRMTFLEYIKTFFMIISLVIIQGNQWFPLRTFL